MPAGGFCPGGSQAGGGPCLERIVYEGINAGLGTAYDTSDESTVTAESHAEARVVCAAWASNRRAANQQRPDVVTDFLPRWEAIVGLTGSSAPLSVRRARLAAKRASIVDPTRAALEAVCSTALGTLYVGVEYSPLASAAIRWPANGWTGKWLSTVAHILVRVAKPASMPQTTFAATCCGVQALLEDFVPAWVSITWGTMNDAGVRGFRLDDPHNLDQETFDP